MLGSKGIVVKCTAVISAMHLFSYGGLVDWGKRTELLLPWPAWFDYRWLMKNPSLTQWSSLNAGFDEFFVSPFHYCSLTFLRVAHLRNMPGSLSIVGQKPVILCRYSYLKSAFSLSESLNMLNIQQHTILLLVENLYVECSLRKQPTLRDATASFSPQNVWNSSPKKFSWATMHFLGGRLYGRFDSTWSYYTATPLIALQG